MAAQSLTSVMVADNNNSDHSHSSSSSSSNNSGRLVDAQGRVLLLRGINVSGCSKTPVAPIGCAVYGSPSFFDHRSVSFVGRPFPLDEIDEHLERLHAWGLSFIRLLVPWEALEHSGPGIYDEDFIDSLIVLLRRAPEYGLKIFIDPHQDTWSRFSGGTGAPGWTFEVVGMDIRNLEATGAARFYTFQDCGSESDDLKMTWLTNYIKLASATMFTIFFGGNELAPSLKYRGEPAQEFLQRHYCAAYAHLAERIKAAHVSSVVGFEVMNEPHPGYIGLESMLAFDYNKDLHLGPTPSALQSFAMGSGIPQGIDNWVRSWPWPTKKSCTLLMNKDRKSAWLPGHSCVWLDHGVWGLDKSGNPTVLKPHYFKTRRDGSPLDFDAHCHVPFIKRYAHAIRKANPEMILFFEPVPNTDPAVTVNDQDLAFKNAVYAPHWYDLSSLFSKTFDGFMTHDVPGLSRGMNVLQASYFGLTGANRNYRNQVTAIVNAGLKRVGKKPCLIGECGIPMDINNKSAYENGDYSHHNNFLDAVINAMEANLVHFTLWNYNPHNDNIYGDHWNGEDFSVYSRSNSQVPSPTSSRLHSRQNSRVSPFTSTTNISSTMVPSVCFDPQSLEPRSLAISASGNGSNSSLAVNGAHQSSTKLKESRRFSLKDSTVPPICTNESDDLMADLVHLKPHVDDVESKRKSADMHRRASLTPVTPFDITELSYNDPFELDHAHIGGRALDAIIRPYAPKVAGNPLRMRFTLQTLEFQLIFTTPIVTSSHKATRASRTTEIFVPAYHYGAFEQPIVTVSDGSWTYDRKCQTLLWTIDPLERVELNIPPKPFSLRSLFWPVPGEYDDILPIEPGVNVHTLRITAPPSVTATATTSTTTV